ncbi:acyl-CoA dehydrogenase family protein, partial [Pseudomonas sp.]|uniref:acyl-CoA dehydrogenase family protein n=1 Tax=Pseudomonas sp. TaxID=306 RepID=UPI002579EE35
MIAMIPRTIFSSDHELFRDSVRKFLEQDAVPFHAQWEKDGFIDRALWNKAGEAGMLCSHIPEEYGGIGADFLYSTVVIEEIGKLGLTGIGFSLHSDIVAPYILHYGSEALKQKYLPKMVTGEMVTAIAMTEPGAGSDLQGVKTTAVLDGDDYIINGSKTFITNGYLADLVIVVAKTDPKAGAKGTSLFLVEAGLAGFTKGQNLEKLGMKAQDTAELLLRAAAHQLSRATRAGGGGGAAGEAAPVGLPELTPHAEAWEEPDVGVLALCALEGTMMPLLAELFSPTPRKLEQSVDLLSSLMPSVVAPAVAATSGAALPPRAQRLAHASLRVLLRVVNGAAGASGPGGVAAAAPATTRAWRKHVAKLFGSPSFFG